MKYIISKINNISHIQQIQRRGRPNILGQQQRIQGLPQQRRLYDNLLNMHIICQMFWSKQAQLFSLANEIIVFFTISIDKQIKMNSTKRSRISLKSNKPNNFRLLIKQRSNFRQAGYPPQQTASSKALLGEDRDGPQIKNVTEMKEYVRNRIKTQHQNIRNQSTTKSNDNQRSFRKTFVNQLQASPSKQLLKTPSNNSLNKTQTLINSPITNHLKMLQDKAQTLLRQKLQHCSTFRNKTNEQLQQQLKDLINSIRELQQVNPQSIESQVSLINSKIVLFQRLMAQNTAESEIMKKYLLNKISNKSKMKRLKTEGLIENHRYSYRDIDIVKEALINTSQNTQSFMAPSKVAYNIYKHKQERFNAGRDRQPLPRSSYNRQFLKYDNVVEEQIHPLNNVIMSRSSSANMFNSSYKHNFGPKASSRVNIKELDAYKNKIKVIPISFNGLSGRKSSVSFRQYDITMNKSVRMIRPYESPLKMPTKYLLSESKRQYTKQAFNPSRTVIKHQNLHKLRYQYKNMLRT